MGIVEAVEMAVKLLDNNLTPDEHEELQDWFENTTHDIRHFLLVKFIAEVLFHKWAIDWIVDDKTVKYKRIYAHEIDVNVILEEESKLFSEHMSNTGRLVEKTNFQSSYNLPATPAEAPEQTKPLCPKDIEDMTDILCGDRK